MRMRQTFGLSLALLLVSTTAMAKPAQPDREQPSIKAKPTKTAAAKPATPAKAKPAAAKSTDKRQPSHAKVAARAAPRAAVATLPPPDTYIGPLQAVGQREVGRAAWYGGYHLGRRTASGDRLDAVRLTCAHRSLPLHSLVRVTNLRNGRSVVATITDRGPVSPKLLIDVSPRVADGLDMRRAGIVQVAVEPVVPVAAARH